ncbi:MAG TPA: class I SAM-dependent methyltransferase [Kofleriaceae bacterium]|nr:class I SAM-dependent methyltransferase [Kofleriaceae bacterium]
MSGWLDQRLYRHPFTGASAQRYTRLERPGFGDLDERLVARWAPDLAGARVVLDVGAGPGTLAAHLRAARPELLVIEVEPSADFAPTPGRLRAYGEALPLAGASVDLAVCLSSIRHVGDRAATLRELRRVVRPGGVAHLVELDPAASRARVAAHARRVRSRLLAAAFGPLVVYTAPHAREIAGLARAAGWSVVEQLDDPVQPVYDLRLA